MVKVGDGPGVEGLEATALGRSEVVGKGEGGEVVEGAADLPEAALVLDGAGGDCGGSRLGAQPAERVAQQLSAVGLVGAAEELDQAQGLAPGQTVALGAIEDLVLVLVAERAQGVRERRADGAPGQPLLRGAREAGADGQARLDPARLVAQEPRDAARGQPFLFGQRAGHLRLVVRGDGARRGVGQQQPPLELHRRARPLDDHGDRDRALRAPALKALEAVEDLEAPVVAGRDDAQRQLSQLLRRAQALARAQPGEAGAEPVDGHRPDGAGLGLGHGSPITAAWRRGACRRVDQREVGDHTQVQLAAPLLVLDLHPQAGTLERRGCDLLAGARRQATGPVQLHQATTGERQAARARALQDEVFRHPVEGGRDAFKRVNYLDHRVAALARALPSRGDRAGVEAGRRHLLAEIRIEKLGGFHGGSWWRRTRSFGRPEP